MNFILKDSYSHNTDSYALLLVEDRGVITPSIDDLVYFCLKTGASVKQGHFPDPHDLITSILSYYQGVI